MEKVKVRHALISWQDEDNVTQTAYRGDVVELPAKDVERLRKHGAIIKPQVDLDRPGILAELPESPSDEELVAWVMSANPAEVAAISAERPDLIPRFKGVIAGIELDRHRQDNHLELVRDALDDLPIDEETQLPVIPTGDEDIFIDPSLSAGALNSGIIPSQPATGGQSDSVVAPPAPSAADSGPSTGMGHDPEDPEDEPVDYSELVKGTPDDVATFIHDNPIEAEKVLDAETAATQGSPRAGVVLAARAAIASLSS